MDLLSYAALGLKHSFELDETKSESGQPQASPRPYRLGWHLGSESPLLKMKFFFHTGFLQMESREHEHQKIISQSMCENVGIVDTGLYVSLLGCKNLHFKFYA